MFHMIDFIGDDLLLFCHFDFFVQTFATPKRMATTAKMNQSNQQTAAFAMKGQTIVAQMKK
tara:strand:+ start:231 stop:413 length:183 start_codon:yes stop_codon:yes gene_type:complete